MTRTGDHSTFHLGVAFKTIHRNLFQRRQLLDSIISPLLQFMMSKRDYICIAGVWHIDADLFGPFDKG
jgi:hypothetical protein